MTIATSPKPTRSSRPHTHQATRTLTRTERIAVSTDARVTPRATRSVSLSASSTQGGRILGCYADPRGRQREVITRPGHAGSVLVLDRDARTLGDKRLVAHLAADEPRENASLICSHYLRDPRGRWCRPVTAEDLKAQASISDPLQDLAAEAGADHAPCSAQTAAALLDRCGRAHRLGSVTRRLSIPELRWLRLPGDGEPGVPQPVSVREVVAGLESYEPVRACTVLALTRHREDSAVSVAVLRAELARLDASRIVLNRGLRQAVLSAVRTQGLSMSEIAVRCGRVKRDARGNASGETSWLARRVGILPEGGESEPTPWVHSEVLALIARTGLGISPREVELG